MKKGSNTAYEFQWGERHSLVSAEYWVDAYGPYVLWNPNAIDYVVISGDRYLDTYASQGMLQEWRVFSRKLLESRNRDALIRSSFKARQRYFDFYRTFQKRSISKIDNSDLFRLLSEYIAVLKKISYPFVASQPEGIDAVTNTLQRLLARKKAGHLMAVLITPTVPDIIFHEQADLQSLAQKRTVSDKSLYRHALKYAWLFFNSYDVNANIQFLKLRLRESFDKESKLHEMTNLKRRQKVIFRSLRDKDIETLCSFLQRLSIVRLELKDCWGGAEFRFLSLFKEIAERISVPFDSMMAAYTLQDYRLALLADQLLPKEKITHRKKLYIFWKRRKVRLIEDSIEMRRIIKAVRGRIITKRLAAIHGVSANPGKVRGRVRLVRSVDIGQLLKDLKQFKKGDILVTWMTQPNMVPIVRKASAIVADEGGITSHAAVIAREFKIPCVVGAKIATKVLTDGDEIEVDADNGVVRILK